MTDTEYDLVVRQMEELRKAKIPVAGVPGAGAERRYGQLYQRLVKAGRAPQLKEKYRR